MEHAVSTLVPSHDVAFRVDRSGPGKDSARDINRAELAPAQQIAMATAGINIPSDNVAARVDPQRVGEGSGSAREIKRSELAPAQQIAMGHTVGVRSHDVAARVDPASVGEDDEGTREINHSEIAPAQQKAMSSRSAARGQPG